MPDHIPALIRMLAADQERGIDPFSIEYEYAPAPPPSDRPPFIIDPPPWSANYQPPVAATPTDDAATVEPPHPTPKLYM